jgi:hypothetical protein
MGPIEYFLMGWTQSVHCQYMHWSYVMLWGRYNFFLWTGLDLYIVNICTSHIPCYGSDQIFFNVLNSVCALSIYAQVVCCAMGPIEYFLMDQTRSVHCQCMHKSYTAPWGQSNIFSWTGLGLCIVNICTSHIPGYRADTIYIYARIICHAMGPIQLFLMDRTRSVHCKYMHRSDPGLWGRYNFFLWTGLDL